MKRIDISSPKHPNTFAIVDDEDYSDLQQFKWFRIGTGHVARHKPRPDGGGTEYMHRRIMGNPPCLVDHANRDTLDNRRTNLRLATRQNNAANSVGRARSGFKGVSAHPGGHWRARIMVDGKQVCLGLHPTPEAAHEAYKAAADRYFGVFARTGLRKGIQNAEKTNAPEGASNMEAEVGIEPAYADLQSGRKSRQRKG